MSDKGTRIRMDYDLAGPLLRRACEEHNGRMSLNDVRAWICATYGVADDGGPNLTNRLRRLLEHLLASGQFRLDGTGRRKWLVPVADSAAPAAPHAPAPAEAHGEHEGTGSPVIERLLREQAEFRKLLATVLQNLGPSAGSWEYKIVRAKDNGAGSIDYGEDDGPTSRLLARNFSLHQMLSRLGADGWELIGMDPESYIFKRAKKG